MTDPIYPWLDPIEVRRLAERLMQPDRESAHAVPDADFDAGFVGYDAVPITALPSNQLATQPPAPPAYEEPITTAAACPPPSQNPAAASGPFLERIIRFRDWMRQNFSATGIYILDREGLVVFDESQHGRLHFLARSLALASRRPGVSPGNVHVKIGTGSTLELIPLETAYGRLILGAVVPQPLGLTSIKEVKDALAMAALPGES